MEKLWPDAESTGDEDVGKGCPRPEPAKELGIPIIQAP